MESTGTSSASSKRLDSRHKRCNCERSNCAKGNCVCFRNKRNCTQACTCQNCSNRDPSAASTKEGGERMDTSCVCVTHCTHVLCRCRKAGVGCTKRCKCVGCQNRYGKRGGNSDMKSGTDLDLNIPLVE